MMRPSSNNSRPPIREPESIVGIGIIEKEAKADGRSYIRLSIKPFQNRIKNFIIAIKTVMKVFYI
jgi:hypothetical protein